MHSGNSKGQQRVAVYLVKRWITRQVGGISSTREGTCSCDTDMDDLERHGDRRQGRTTTSGPTGDELIRMAEKAKWRQRSEFMAQPAVQLGCGDSG
jgi:hypothetical protein